MNEEKKPVVVSGFRCQAKFLNSTPSSTIIRTMATFTYNKNPRDTSSDPSSGPGEVNIGPGEAGYRFSRNDNDCVTSVYAVVVTNNAGAFEATAPAPDGYCLIAPLFELRPKPSIAKDTKEPGPHLWLLGESFEPEKPGEKIILSEKSKPEY
jgi:hypothetical protein